MVRLGFVFAGQGAQYVGMGEEFYNNYPIAKEVYQRASKILDLDLMEICFTDSQGLLSKTAYVQPAILTTSMAIFEVVKEFGIKPYLVAGLSLGEYSALTAAGAIKLEDVLPLVYKRGQLMQDAVPLGEGAMAAVMGIKATVVEDVCKGLGQVSIANYNCPGQLVISGATNAVEVACDLIKKQGGKTRMLKVSIPSHSKLMVKAAGEFSSYLSNITWLDSQIGVVSNVNAQVNSKEQIADLLAEQLYFPVLWEQSVRYFMDRVQGIIEIGPGETLTGLIKRIDSSYALGAINNKESLVQKFKEVKGIDH